MHAMPKHAGVTLKSVLITLFFLSLHLPVGMTPAAVEDPRSKAFPAPSKEHSVKKKESKSSVADSVTVNQVKTVEGDERTEPQGKCEGGSVPASEGVVTDKVVREEEKYEPQKVLQPQVESSFKEPVPAEGNQKPAEKEREEDQQASGSQSERFSQSTLQKSPPEVSNAEALESTQPVLESKESETFHQSPSELSGSGNISSESVDTLDELVDQLVQDSSGKSQVEKSEEQVQKGDEEKPSSDEQYVVRAQPKTVVEKTEEGEDVKLWTIPADGSIQIEGREEGSVENVLIPPPGDNSKRNMTYDEEGTRVIDSVTENAVTEDIPSFSEWAQKQLAEAERKKGGHNMTGGGNGQSRTTVSQKLRSKNYASPDCGAKIIAANVEAQNPSAVISHSRDEYMLNVCTNKVWFVIELCEGIQAKKVEIANFELFSSSPRDFVVSISDRYPTRDWRSVGVFTAEDERNVQNFSLSQHLFGKFVKVELSSHYGSEHYCPVSLFRVYGASEYEVLDREDEHAENAVESDIDDDDETLEDFGGGGNQQQPQNLFGSARDAVMSIVKKAAQALVKGDTKEQSNTLELGMASLSCNYSSCVTPVHQVVCHNCSIPFFDRLYDLFSCAYEDLRRTKRGMWDLVRDGGVCYSFGLELPAYLQSTPYDNRVPYLMALISQEYLAALCNVMAEEDRKLRMNLTLSGKLRKVDGIQKQADETPMDYSIDGSQETCSLEPTRTDDPPPTPTAADPTPISTATLHVDPHTTIPPSLDSSTNVHTEQPTIQPTKTLKEEEVVTVEMVQQPLVPTKAKGTSSQVETVVSKESASVTVNLGEPEKAAKPVAVPEVQEGEAVTVPKPPAPDGKPHKTSNKVTQKEAVKKEDVTPVTPQQPQVDVNLDSLFSEVEATMEGAAGDSSSAVPVGTIPTVQQGQKESVFVRLSNKIKALELNLSLSSQYLEELSRRYKKQMEELQKALNKTSATANDTAKQASEWQKLHREATLTLQGQVDNLTQAVKKLTEDRDSIHGKVLGQHLVLMLVELVAMVFVIRFCLRRHERRLLSHVPPPPPRNTTFRVGCVSSASRLHTKKKPKKTANAVERRRSVEGVSGHVIPTIKPRRPSEEALNISGTYQNLLLPEQCEAPLRKRRKRRRELHKSASSNNINGEVVEEEGEMGDGEGISIMGSFKGLGAPDGVDEEWWGQVEDNSRTWHGFPPGRQRIQRIVAEAKERRESEASSVAAPVVQVPLTNGLRKGGSGGVEASKVARGKAKAESGLRKILNKIF